MISLENHFLLASAPQGRPNDVPADPSDPCSRFTIQATETQLCSLNPRGEQASLCLSGHAVSQVLAKLILFSGLWPTSASAWRELPGFPTQSWLRSNLPSHPSCWLPPGVGTGTFPQADQAPAGPPGPEPIPPSPQGPPPLALSCFHSQWNFEASLEWAASASSGHGLPAWNLNSTRDHLMPNLFHPVTFATLYRDPAPLT